MPQLDSLLAALLMLITQPRTAILLALLVVAGSVDAVCHRLPNRLLGAAAAWLGAALIGRAVAACAASKIDVADTEFLLARRGCAFCKLGGLH